jgi:nucleotide-binding universal stress UspA family protein
MEILVATDFSESAVTALHTAVRYARPFGARIHLLHVWAPGEVEVTKLLADAAAQAGSDVPVAVAATGGDPAHEVLRYAARHQIALIVVGTHGRTGVSRVLLGSVAERVTRGATCPVLVVPPMAEASSRPADVIADDEASSAARLCLVCAKPTIDLICEPCRTRIRGEALEHKQGEERGGRR